LLSYISAGSVVSHVSFETLLHLFSKEKTSIAGKFFYNTRKEEVVGANFSAFSFPFAKFR